MPRNCRLRMSLSYRSCVTRHTTGNSSGITTCFQNYRGLHPKELFFSIGSFRQTLMGYGKSGINSVLPNVISGSQEPILGGCKLSVFLTRSTNENKKSMVGRPIEPARSRQEMHMETRPENVVAPNKMHSLSEYPSSVEYSNAARAGANQYV